MNFGLPGLLVAGSALGLLLGLLARKLATQEVQHIAILAVVTGLLVRGVESDSSIVIGSIPWILLGLFFATRLLVIRVPPCKES